MKSGWSMQKLGQGWLYPVPGMSLLLPCFWIVFPSYLNWRLSIPVHLERYFSSYILKMFVICIKQKGSHTSSWSLTCGIICSLYYCRSYLIPSIFSHAHWFSMWGFQYQALHFIFHVLISNMFNWPLYTIQDILSK